VAVAFSVVLVILLALGTQKRPPFLEGVGVYVACYDPRRKYTHTFRESQ
jgi:hypothetical protein